MLTLMRSLKAHYEERVATEPKEDKRRKTEKVVDYLQENASGMVCRITKQAAKNKALKLMAEVGISEPRKRYRQYPFEFSGGMRQRIVIAIALAANPDILICDEPTTALDVTIQAQILELINKLKKERNLSIIFITHDLGVVANMADRIAVMYAGKVVEYGTSRERRRTCASRPRATRSPSATSTRCKSTSRSSRRNSPSARHTGRQRGCCIPRRPRLTRPRPSSTALRK